MTDFENKVEDCLLQIRKKTDFVPKIALILGSGLGALAEEINCVETVSYHEIEGFPFSTVAGHKGRFVFGYIGKIPVVIMQGRVHYYEGYDMSDVVLPIRLMRKMGAELLFLTNAAGGINPKLKPGDFMMITDQISSFVPSPLIGPNVEDWGVRFPSMDTIYDKELCRVLQDTAKECDIPLKEGVYVQTTGPNYESPAEVKMLGMLGADAVGMSTTVEAIAGRHMGMRICGISCISNMAGGTAENPLTHEEVSAIADQAAPLFKKLVKTAIANMAE
ncbi:MAG: purine-nucleoside phosphorylase [Lachnospiraceae bacterium]|nr:purine-nucleoside phosphorylase [Lachnospiraceae bacterium]